MSWNTTNEILPTRRHPYALAAIVAVVTLIFAFIVPSAVPEIVGAAASAQATGVTVKLDSADILDISDGESATFEGHFDNDGTIEELEFRFDVEPSLVLSEGDYKLTIGDREIPVSEGENLTIDAAGSPATLRVTDLATTVSSGTKVSLEAPIAKQSATLSGIAINVRSASDEAERDTDDVRELSEENSPQETEGASQESMTVPREELRSVAPYSITPYAAGDRTFRIDKQQNYVLKGNLNIPDFKIPAGELTNGTITLWKGTEVILESNVNSYLSTDSLNQKIFYTGKNGGWYEAAATYEKISGRKYRVILPEITIGGNAQIQFMGVYREAPSTVFSATFTIPTPVCTAESKVQTKQAPRKLTPEEFANGSPVYVVTSTPSNQNRDTSILNRQFDQGRDYQVVGKTSWVYNALAFNPKDNWLYAISQDRGGDPCFPGGNLLQIDPATGEIHNLGPIHKAGSSDSAFETDGDRNVINAGVYTSEGLFVANTSSSGTRRFYKINTDTVTAERVFGNQMSYAEDWAVLPNSQKYMWGFQNKAKAGEKLILERIDTTTGQIATWDLTNIKTIDGRGVSNPSSSWGKAWTYSNGNLGFGSGSSQANQMGFELRIANAESTDPSFQLVNIMNNLPASFNTDGASNLVPPPPELQSNLAVRKLRSETKVTDGEVRTYWTITVENTTNNPSAGGSFFDYLPTDTHYGVNANGPTARFEGFGPDSTKLNGRMPGSDQIGTGAGIYAGMDVPSATSGESRYLRGYVGTIPSHAKVDFIVSAPVRKDKYGNLKTVCSPNKVGLLPKDSEARPADDDNVAVEACFDKVAVDSEPRPVQGSDNEYTVKYNVVVSAPDAPGFDSNEVIYGKLTDTPKFVGAASVTGASVVFKDEFNKPSQATYSPGAGPFELNGNAEPKIIKPKGVDGSTGQHVYEVTVRFKLDRAKLDNSVVPSGQPSQPAGNFRCYVKDGLYEPNFGLMNEAEMGGWKDTDCIPLKNQKMDVLLEKISYDSKAAGKIQNDGLLSGAKFTVYRGDANGKLQFNPDGSVNTDVNPAVQQSTTAAEGRVRLNGLDAPGIYYLIESQAPQGYNLLREPVKFSTAWDDNGNAAIKILSGGALATSGNECEKSSNTSCDREVGIIQIADIRKGELPKTGGAGVGLWVLTGSLIVITGCTALRRRQE